MKRGLATLLALSIPLVVSAAGDEIDVAVTLRDTGYMLGDLLEEHVRVDLPASMRIDGASLPLPGRVAPWLEVRDAKLGRREASGAQELVVTYQIFAESEVAARVPLPAFKLKAHDGADTRIVEVPAQSFLLSPGLPATLTDEDRELQPSPEPAQLSEAATIAAAVASLAVALVCAAYLLWRYDRLPWLPYAPGPLARLWRRWRRRSGRELSREEETALLREWHAALNQSAGETLYPSTLGRLFERAPFLVALRAQIEPVFTASWEGFYASTQATAPPARSVFALLRDAADRERGVPC